MGLTTHPVPRPRTAPGTPRRHDGPAREAYRGVVVGLALALPFWVLVLVAARLF